MDGSSWIDLCLETYFYAHSDEIYNLAYAV